MYPTNETNTEDIIMTFKSIAIATATAITLSACSAYAGGHALAPVSEANGMLVDGDGMTLYTFDKDDAGVSNCNGGCATQWPPLAAPNDADEKGDYTVVTRADGSKMWAYKDEPLYLWIGDKRAGQTTGDGVGGVWHIAKP